LPQNSFLPMWLISQYAWSFMKRTSDCDRSVVWQSHIQCAFRSTVIEAGWI
jgi:hypothetical protein